MPELPRIPFAWLDAPPAVFGTMIRMGRQAVDRAVAETRMQPLGETLPTLVLGERIAEHACGGEKSPALSPIASTGQESDSVASFSRSNCPKRPASRAGDAKPISIAVG